MRVITGNARAYLLRALRKQLLVATHSSGSAALSTPFWPDLDSTHTKDGCLGIRE